MKFAALIPLVAAICNCFVTIFVLSRGLRSSVSRVFLLWGAAITIWNFGTYFMFVIPSTDQEQALFWARFLQFGVIFIPVSLIHLSLLVAQIKVGRAIYYLYAFHVLLALSNFTSFFIPSVHYKTAIQAWYSQAGPGFWLYSLAYQLTIVSVFVLWNKRKKLPPLHRQRLTYLIAAQATLVTFGVNDILPILNIDVYPLVKKPIFPFGSAAAIFYGIMVGYSVLQHQFLGIHVALSKAAARIVRLVFLFSFSMLLLLIVAILSPANQITPYAFFSSLGVFLISATIASIFFPRLLGQGDDTLERRILGDKFEYHDQIQDFIQSIQWYTDTGLLIKDLHELLINTVKVRSYYIILLDETTHAFSIFRSHPEESQNQLPELRSDSPIFEYFKNTSSEYLAFNIAYSAPDETPWETHARKQLKRFSPEFCFPFMAGEGPFGLLIIGEKTSGEPYTRHDLHLLNLLVKSLSLIINQIRLKNQVLLAEELELLGRMSRGMAHDLNNLLTPVSTLLQLCGDGVATQSQMEELLPIAARNVGTMQAYIKEALFFSQHHTPQIHSSRLDLLLHKVVELANPKLKRKKVEAVVEAPERITAEMDEVLIQRLISNLISNAIDASPAGTRITLHLQVLAKTEARRDWFRVRVIDQGEGITRENLKRISSAYFTTKDSGDEQRGFGLGLSICRKIVHLHGGNLTITSEEKKGTTVQVDLPSVQVHAPAQPVTVAA